MCDISNKDLTLDNIPPSNADWFDIYKFALTFDGYTNLNGLEECAAIAKARRHNSLTDLRACLFFEQRRWHHFGNDPSGEAEDYIRSLVDMIRERIASGNLD